MELAGSLVSILDAIVEVGSIVWSNTIVWGSKVIWGM